MAAGSSDITERSLHSLAGDMAAGRTSALSLVQQYSQRITQLDRAGPALRSVIELNPDAPAIARALDAERQYGQLRGPLHGMPLLIKDNIDTHDRMATTAGSLALVGTRPAADAVLVQHLRAAGAVILGKTNCSEWANFRGSRSSGGWSARGGLTRNPYVLDRSASGSSSGSAVAVAASLCAAAVGTETDGSILSPAAVCGVVGLKPTVGLISGCGIIPLAPSQDTAGPMARTVQDVALLLLGLIGPAGVAAETAAWPQRLAALDGQALRGARLGVVRQFMGQHEAVDAVYETVFRALARAGAVLVDPVELPQFDALRGHEKTVLLHEFKAALDAYLPGRGTDATVRSLADVIRFNQRHASTELAWFGQDRLQAAQATTGLQAPAYLAARAACLQLARTEGIEATLQRHRLCALVAPTAGPAWTVDLALGDHGLPGSSSFAAVAGTPAITVPAAQWQGLQLGLSFFAGAYSEPRLLDLAYAFEQATLARMAPRYRATLAHSSGPPP